MVFCAATGGGGWKMMVKGVGIPYLNSQRPAATWSIDYRREPCDPLETGGR